LKLLAEEKQRSHLSYAQSIQKSQSEILAKLRHPTGQLALLNPGRQSQNPTPLRPLVLPYAAIDFDDQNKAQQAVEMAGCLVHYQDHGDVCVAIGNNPYAGGFIYIVGNFLSGELVGRERGGLELDGIHRARVTLTMRGQTTRWIAPFEAISEPDATRVRGRLTGFVEDGNILAANAKPVRDFRGWLWQGNQCVSESPDCLRASFFSIRLPVEMFREDLFQRPRPIWPPKDLDQIQVRVEIFSPNTTEPVFDSNSPGTTPPFALSDLANTLQAGEMLHIRKLGGSSQDIITLQGREDAEDRSPRWIKRVIQRLPIDGEQPAMRAQETLHTSLGSYEVTLTGDASAIDRSLSAVATRVSWYVAAMLGAIVLAWLLIEISFLRRVAILTKRAAAVSYNVQDHQDARVEKRISALDLSDLRGSDELGILAGGLSDLLQRVKDDVQREHIRAQQERDMWHAVGHEIMSPLQSLMVLHPQQEDASYRYIQRMQQAVRVLYGSASPSEALEAATLQLETIDLNEFLANIADNAHFAGLQDVQFERAKHPVMIRADEFSLEDAVTHILRNADRYRPPGTPIVIKLASGETSVSIMIHNQGSSIDPSMLERIFEYGVSDANLPGNGEHRGQGLFVAKTYMAKMGGTISGQNVKDGVTFTLTLSRVNG
jgi:signal transduction histidine kinase